MLSVFLCSENLSGSLVQEEPFQLATERRAKERQELEKRMAEEEARKMQQLEEVRQQEEEQKKEELVKLRKELVISWAACTLTNPGLSLLCFLVELGPTIPIHQVKGNSTVSLRCIPASASPWYFYFILFYCFSGTCLYFSGTCVCS